MKTKTKWVVISLITFLLSFILSPFLNQEDKMNQAIVPTIYTLSGIMFSIGMSIACTFNPSQIRNNQVFQRVKKNITNVINTFLMYFMLSTVTFLASQILVRSYIPVVNFTLIFDPKILALLFSIVSLIYFIVNFLTIQKLAFDITERAINENK